ncbi:MAG TPA: LuxR C-terminal-related transcriptional regulator [Acidobacteriota bacterium]|nr:LuxR C-terminal-related transcriptional regulator [Acidobacteriota bacterium]HMZ79986.1 LuxR C-terminal-related transcriptional regulator [Acidobacteriota bacterium]HNB72153.1 LuxR C-terminal-related transcriptional regulator [Acidobacteriota bacterium]
MNLHDLKKLVEGTADAAFVSDSNGTIIGWNKGAEALFGISAAEAVGKFCGDMVSGHDECGQVCSQECSVQQAVRENRPMSNFDLHIKSQQGYQWTNTSTLLVSVANSEFPYSVHIFRRIDVRKRLELLIRDFIVAETQLPAEQVTSLISTTRAPAAAIELTDRELQVLKLMARGLPTSQIATTLHISRTTANNHIQHILQKFNVHSRLEAIRRAELAGLLKHS